MTATKKKNRRPRILVLETYSEAAWAVRRAGADAVGVSPRNVDKVEEALGSEAWDGILLTGGGDVDPALYGEQAHKKVYGVSETRDFTEWMALDYARDLGIPVLGICRGSQLMAVHNGGRLKQHIGGHRGKSHLVFTEPGAKLRRTIGEHGYFVSLHHQVISRHGNGFRVAARSREGYIEAIESRDGRCLGVQWHPEMDHARNPDSQRIFRWFAIEAAKRAGLNKPKVQEPHRFVPQGRAPKRPAKNRKAGQVQLPLAPGANAPTRKRTPSMKGVTVSWLCPHCALRFDNSEDREDHIEFVHGDPRAALRGLSTAEPPPGHPDWMTNDPIERLDDALSNDSDWLGS